MITRQDLVEWQLRVASGAPLPKSQDEVSMCIGVCTPRVCVLTLSMYSWASTATRSRRASMPRTRAPASCRTQADWRSCSRPPSRIMCASTLVCVRATTCRSTTILWSLSSSHGMPTAPPLCVASTRHSPTMSVVLPIILHTTYRWYLLKCLSIFNALFVHRWSLVCQPT